MKRHSLLSFLCLSTIFLSAISTGFAQEANATEEPEAVSYYRQVRPILQRHCSGCHQPAKRGGELLLTSYEGFQKGGDQGPCFVPNKPDESLILDYISGEEPAMPLNADPLEPAQIELIARWISEGALDDTPPRAQDTISAENPPSYERPPVVTALDYSPDGTLLAVSGYHEVLLHKADGSGLAGRLIGRAQRINSIAFSPDGQLLAAVGGTPALFGEVQIWDVKSQALLASETVSFDTLHGASFNNDGSMLSFGGADNRAYVFRLSRNEEGELETEQTVRFDAHADWVLDTTFSLKQDHLITVSRDMSMKLVIVENAQFVDNITSITPGALKGGLAAVERHPQKEQVLAGGADGTPNLYKIFRTRKRIIGDNFNHIRSYKKLPGRIFDLEFNSDGSMFVVGSSTATGGTARIFKTGEYDETKTNNDGGLAQTFAETKKRSDVDMLVQELEVKTPIYAVAFRGDGQQVAVAGFDGIVRLFGVDDGRLVKEFLPVELAPAETAASK